MTWNGTFIRQSMRLKWTLILIGILTPIAIVIVGFRIISSPAFVLRHALNLDRLPTSISHLQMGSDVWTDEMRSFYFELDENEFPALLAGRPFEHDKSFRPASVETMHVLPPVRIVAHARYIWLVPGAMCVLSANQERTRVIVAFDAD